jgi:hypothetical protein
VRFIAQFAAQYGAIHAGQAEIEQDAVESLADGKMQAGNAVGSGIDDVAARFQKVVEISGDRGIVFDDQDAHVAAQTIR